MVVKEERRKLNHYHNIVVAISTIHKSFTPQRIGTIGTVERVVA